MLPLPATIAPALVIAEKRPIFDLERGTGPPSLSDGRQSPGGLQPQLVASGMEVDFLFVLSCTTGWEEWMKTKNPPTAPGT